MATVKRFSILDIYEYACINLDILTETFGDDFYGEYVSRWPEYCVSLFNSEALPVGYLLGKVEGKKGDAQAKDWHGHVTVC
jgi:N-terminal acetyltransferase B complex catalytic subunit